MPASSRLVFELALDLARKVLRPGVLFELSEAYIPLAQEDSCTVESTPPATRGVNSERRSVGDRAEPPLRLTRGLNGLAQLPGFGFEEDLPPQHLTQEEWEEQDWEDLEWYSGRIAAVRRYFECYGQGKLADPEMLSAGLRDEAVAMFTRYYFNVWKIAMACRHNNRRAARALAVKVFRVLPGQLPGWADDPTVGGRDAMIYLTAAIRLMEVINQ